MQRRHYIQIGGSLLLSVFLLGVLIVPVAAKSTLTQHTTQKRDNAAGISASIYLLTQTLQPLFQSKMSQQVPLKFTQALTSSVSNLPSQQKALALHMATALFAPSATLTSLTPQQSGLAAGIRTDLYPNDRHPLNSKILISFSTAGQSSVIVNGSSLGGGPQLVHGQLSTFQIPMGKIQSINTTPNCGDAALKTTLQLPTSIQGQQAPAASSSPSSAASQKEDVYVEIPVASLSTAANSMGAIQADPTNNNITAKNVRMSVSGRNLLITTDVYSKPPVALIGPPLAPLYLGAVTTTAIPIATDGKLAMKILDTTFKIFNAIPISINSYNATIQQQMNMQMSKALAGNFTITQAGIGNNAAVPCAASDSLLLEGTASGVG